MSSPRTTRDTLIIIAAILIILMILRNAQVIVVPILLSMFFAIIAATPVGMLKNRGFSVPVSVAIVFVFFIVLEITAILLIGNTFVSFIQALPGYQEKLDGLLIAIDSGLVGMGVDVSSTGFQQLLNTRQIVNLANTLAVSIGDIVSNAFLITFTVLFILLEAWEFPSKLQAMKGVSEIAVLKEMGKIINSTKHYIAIKTITSLLTGVLIGFGVAMVDLDFPVLWGFLAFALNFIPNIGSIIAAIPAVLLAMLQLDSMGVLAVLAIFLAVNTFVGSVLEPQFMGRRVGLSTLVVFISLIFWGWIFGPVGMLLSVPLTMVIKFSAEAHEEGKWIAVLLSPVPEEKVQEG
jgi:predicted PurR-regulated permease PerM